MFFFFNDTATTEIYTLSLHDALPIWHLLSCTCLSKTLPYLQYDCSSDLDGYFVSETVTDLAVTEACGFYPGSAITCVVFASNKAGDGDTNQKQVTLSCIGKSGISTVLSTLFRFNDEMN